VGSNRHSTSNQPWSTDPDECATKSPARGHANGQQAADRTVFIGHEWPTSEAVNGTHQCLVGLIQ